MRSTAGRLPDFTTLNRRLRIALGDDDALLVDRRPNAYVASFPAEIVTCRLGDRRVVRLFCKYESGASDGSDGHRGGVVYEAEVYRQLLARAGMSTPQFYGGWSDATGNGGLLVIEYLEDALRLNKTRDSSSLLVRAAVWIARFQRLMTQRRLEAPAHVRRYGRDYYLGWSQHAADHVARAGLHYHWLAPLREGFEGCLHLLTDGGHVPIHGEFYPRNVLVHGGRIRPVDWESAALAVGEIDLASLVERWSPDVTDACRAAYARTRWPGRPPSDFERRLDLARIYLHFRWIAAGSFLSAPARSLWRFEDLRSTGERLGFLPARRTPSIRTPSSPGLNS